MNASSPGKGSAYSMGRSRTDCQNDTEIHIMKTVNNRALFAFQPSNVMLPE